jgi:hypothetical protein
MNRNLLLAIAWFGMCIYIGSVIHEVEVYMIVPHSHPEWMNTAVLSFYIPHLVLLGSGIVVNFLAWLLNKRILALVSGIVYVAALAFFPFYAEQMLIQIALCFIAYAMLKPKNQSV